MVVVAVVVAKFIVFFCYEVCLGMGFDGGGGWF